jgi:maleate isomerase
MNRRLRLGMLTPSSNSVLEPATSAMLAGVDGVSAHFSRFRVTEIALSPQALAQFDDGEILAAAELLAHAKVHSIAWNGTSACWLGFAADERLVARIQSATGIPACTSVLAYRDIFRLTNARRVALVTPYTDDVQAKIAENWGAEGFACVAERHAGRRDNFSFSEITADEVLAMARAVAAEKPDAIAIVCTNMVGATLADALERELGIPVYDSIATAVWASLRIAGVSPAEVQGYGRLFTDPRLNQG